ncbi:MAG TPA: lysylphosphatidylglycerol synthase transmembrane domain-containing protein [Vicinamibacterales bacterium]|nr:lysylphosphatidylglycerol synthase transmembrane domain-containing protein [Vicinamibacterales bacterium]
MSTAPTPKSRIPWHTIVIAAATIGLLWLFFRNIDFHQTWRAMTQAHWTYLAAAVVVTMGTYTLRAIRWLALLRPLGQARLRTSFRTTVIGFTATFLLPGRVGEILRPFILAKQDGLKFTATFATVILERLLDVSTVLVLFAVSIQLLTVDIGPEFEAASLAVGAGAIGALVLLFAMAGHPERLGLWAGKLGARLPRKAADMLTHLVRTFAEGLVVMRRPSDLLAAVLWSFPVWISIGIGIWLTSHAFDLTLSFVGAFLVVGYLAVGVSVPTPGGAGGFHYFYLLALTRFFGADPSVAAAAAIILHAISFVPITFLGLFFMWQDGLTFGSLKQMRAEAQAAEKP